MKKIPLITLISFFLLIPNIDAAYKTTTETKYHYYFFSEPYTKDKIDVLKNNSINYTRFADYRDWETISATPVTLTYGSTVDVNSWSLDKFYAMWYELDRRGNVVCKNVNGEDTCSKDLKEKNGNWYYHFHGAYSANIPAVGDWDGIVDRDSGDNTPNDVKINNLLGDYKAHKCATLLTDNTLNRVNEGGYVVYGGTGANYNNTYISITRKAKRPEDIEEYTKEEDEDGNITEKGNIIWSGDPNSGSGHFSNCGTDKVVATNGIVYSPALYRITTETDKYNCIADSPVKNGECNNTVNVSSECEKKTFEVVEDGKSIDNPEANAARVVVGYKQNVTLTNLLTPTTIYQGGGVKIGFIYKSTVEVDIGDIEYDGNGAREQLKTKLNDKIRNTLLDFQTIAFNISNGAALTFTDEKNKEYKISPTQMQTSCKQQGDIINDGKVITTCTIFLPESEVELGTGEVTYKNSIGEGINNEFYTPIKYNGKLYMSAKFENLTAINGINLDSWMKNITVTYDGKRNRASNCEINTYPRFYEEDNKTYKFIYRPIDINNPFPNRNAGVNWYSWYEEPANRNRLESSYDEVEYQMKLDNQKVIDIKRYNNLHSYLDWYGISDSGKSDFVRGYGGDTP